MRSLSGSVFAAQHTAISRRGGPARPRFDTRSRESLPLLFASVNGSAREPIHTGVRSIMRTTSAIFLALFLSSSVAPQSPAPAPAPAPRPNPNPTDVAGIPVNYDEAKAGS